MKPTLLLAAAAGLLTCWPGGGVAKAAGLDFWLVVNKGEVQVLSAPLGTPVSEKAVVLQVTARRIELWPTSARIEASGTIRLDLAPTPVAAGPGPEEDPLPSAPSSLDLLPPADDSRPDPRR